MSQKLANHEKLGTSDGVESTVKETITSNIKELQAKWERLRDNISASVETLQQELSDWFSLVQLQLQSYISKADQLLQKMYAVVCVDAQYDDTLNTQIQSASDVILSHSEVFSEKVSQMFHALLAEVYNRRPPEDAKTIDISELDYEPLSLEDIAKVKVMENTWNIYWDQGKRYPILLKLRVKVLEYMTVIFEGQAFCRRHFEIDLESLENALFNYRVS